MAFKKYSRNPYNPLSDKPYKLSRSRIDNYINCPRCFYMHERKGINAPSGPTFTLNNAVDNLYKNDTDLLNYILFTKESKDFYTKSSTVSMNDLIKLQEGFGIYMSD